MIKGFYIACLLLAFSSTVRGQQLPSAVYLASQSGGAGLGLLFSSTLFPETQPNDFDEDGMTRIWDIKHGQDGLWAQSLELDDHREYVSIVGGTILGPTTAVFDSGITPHITGTSIEFSEMKSNVVYYFRMRVKNGTEYSPFSNDLSVETSLADAVRPIPSGAIASGITSTGATIGWTVDEAGCTNTVQYGTTPSYGTTVTASSGLTPSVVLSGLSPGTSYYFEVHSTDGAGNDGHEDGTFETLPSVDPNPGGMRWVRGMPCANGPAAATGIAVDVSGNAVVSGSFAGTVDFGAGGGQFSSTGGAAATDGFVVKYTSAGVIDWVKTFGTNQGDYAQCIAVDSQSSVFVAGRYQGGVNFGAGVLTNAGSSDIFVLKYNSAGTLQWSKRFGGTGSDIVEQGSTMTVDGSGNVIVVAKFQGTANFGGTILVSAGSDDGVVLKLAGTTGSTLWAKRFGGSNIDVPKGVAVDNAGDVVMTGYFFATTDLGGGTLTAAGGVNDTDIILAKYSGASGTFVWGKRFGNTLGDNGQGVATDPNTGDILITGLFKSTVNFGGPSNLDSYANGGIFLVGLNSSGSYLWGKATGSGTTADLGLAVTVNSSGKVALTGKSTSGIYFGGSSMLLGNGQPNFFIASFNILSASTEPSYQWARMVGSGTTGASQGNGVAFDASGRVLAAGSMLGTLDFGGATLSALGGYGAGWAAQYVNE